MLFQQATPQLFTGASSSSIMDTSSPSDTAKPQHRNIRNTSMYWDLDIHISLPASSHVDCPHLLDLSRVVPREGANPSLTVADAVATCLFKWNVRSLASLLDMTKKHFCWTRTTSYGEQTYVERKLNSIEVGRIGKNDLWPTITAYFDIHQDGSWNLVPADMAPHQHPDYLKHLEHCKDEKCNWEENATKLAEHFILHRLWRDKGGRVTFRWEVDGEVITCGDLVGPPQGKENFEVKEAARRLYDDVDLGRNKPHFTWPQSPARIWESPEPDSPIPEFPVRHMSPVHRAKPAIAKKALKKAKRGGGFVDLTTDE